MGSGPLSTSCTARGRSPGLVGLQHSLLIASNPPKGNLSSRPPADQLTQYRSSLTHSLWAGKQ